MENFLSKRAVCRLSGGQVHSDHRLSSNLDGDLIVTEIFPSSSTENEWRGVILMDIASSATGHLTTGWRAAIGLLHPALPFFLSWWAKFWLLFCLPVFVVFNSPKHTSYGVVELDLILIAFLLLFTRVSFSTFHLFTLGTTTVFTLYRSFLSRLAGWLGEWMNGKEK